MKRFSFVVVILVASMACGRGSAPTAPTPVVVAPTPPATAAARILAVTISATKDEVTVNQTSVLNATALFDDGSLMPITPTWESDSSNVTVLGNGPVALVTGQKIGSALITATAAGIVTKRMIIVGPLPKE